MSTTSKQSGMKRSTMLRRTCAMAGVVAVIGAGVSGPAAIASHEVSAGRPHTCAARHWVASWSASPTDAFAPYDPSLHVVPPALADQTVRMVITPHRGGKLLRVHLSNRFGDTATTFAHVTIGHQSNGSSAGRLRNVTFDHQRSVTVATGEDVISDPVRLKFVAFQPLAVSMFIPTSGPPTKHWNANATSYYSLPGSGDLTKDTNGSGFTGITDAWLFVDGLDVKAAPRARTIVAFGDSITDGFRGRRQDRPAGPAQGRG